MSGSQKQGLNGPGPRPSSPLLEFFLRTIRRMSVRMERWRRGLRREEEDHGSCLEENLSPDKPQGRWAAAGDSAGPEAGWRPGVPSAVSARGELQTLQRPCEQKPQGSESATGLSRCNSWRWRYKRKEDAQPSGSFQSGGGDRPKRREEATRAKGGEPSSSPRGQGRPPHRALGRWAAFPR